MPTNAIASLPVAIEPDVVLPWQGACMSEDAACKVAHLIASFVHSYKESQGKIHLQTWLEGEFSRFPGAWQSDEERSQCVSDIIKASEHIEQNHKELQQHLARGKSTESWLAGKIEYGAKASGIVNIGNYAGSIDTALSTATEQMRDSVRTQAGTVNMNRQLHGFIAEQHHANTFNIDAAAKGSPYRAKVLTPEQGQAYGKNSVDIGIYDQNDKLVKRYQSKYCDSAAKTEQAFSENQYVGQGKLVPEGQGKDVSRGQEFIEIEGVQSKPLSHAKAQELREQAQIKKETKQYKWDDLNRTTIAKNIGTQALVAAGIGVAFQGSRILARRAWHWLCGEESNEASDDLQEFFETSVATGASTGSTVAITGAITVAARNGWIPALQKTPAVWIAPIVYLGMEQAKVAYKFMTGELDGPEALDALGNISSATVGSLAAGGYGMATGAALGTCFGPVGTFIGGFVGGCVGGIAGSAIGEAIYEGAKNLASAIGEGIKSVASSVCNTISSCWNALFG